MLRSARALTPITRGATVALLAALATACSAFQPKARVTRRAATAPERTAVVECAAAVVTGEGFQVTERRPDLGRLSASTGAPHLDVAPALPKGGGDLPGEPAGGSDAPVDQLMVGIAKHPLTEGLALVVRASSAVGDSATVPSPRAAVARDRIIRSCAYLLG